VDGSKFYIDHMSNVSIDDIPVSYSPYRVAFRGEVWTAKAILEESIGQQERATRGVGTFTDPTTGDVILNSTPEQRRALIRYAHNAKVLAVMNNIKGGPFAAIGAIGGLLDGDIDRALVGSSVGAALDASMDLGGGVRPFSGQGQRARESGLLDPLVSDLPTVSVGTKRVLNLGSGANPMIGAINVDIKAGAGVDVVADAAALPFKSGAFSEVHAINPFGFNPVSAETARVMQPGGLLRVSGTARNPYAKPISPEAARAAGFELVETAPLADVHNFGVQRLSSGEPLNTASSTTTTYRRLP
jgi:hypothetical protein